MLKRLAELKMLKDAELAEKKRVEREIAEKEVAAAEEAKNKKGKEREETVYNSKAGIAVINSGNAIMKAMGFKMQSVC
jgi:hypothetical protein